MNQNQEPKAVLTTDEAAYLAGLHRRTFEKLLVEGKGPPSFAYGKRRRFTRAALMAWIDSQPPA